MEAIRVTVRQAEVSYAKVDVPATTIEEAKAYLADPCALDNLIAEQQPKWEIGNCSLEVTSGLGDELSDEHRNAFIEAAQQCYEEEGSVEIDDNAEVSVGGDGNGAYVQAWVWVYNDEAGIPEKDQEEDHAAAIPA